MASAIIVIEEKDGQATVEFVDSDTKLSSQRTINIVGLDEEGRYQRYADHERTFNHRLAIGMIKEQEPTQGIPPGLEEEPEEETEEE